MNHSSLTVHRAMRVFIGGSDCAFAGATIARVAFLPKGDDGNDFFAIARANDERTSASTRARERDDDDDDGRFARARARESPQAFARVDREANIAFVWINARARTDAEASAVAEDVVAYCAKTLEEGEEACACAASRDESLRPSDESASVYEDVFNGARESAYGDGVERRTLGEDGIAIADLALEKIVATLTACGVKMRILYAHGYGSGEDSKVVTDRLARALEASGFGARGYDAERVWALETTRAARDDASELYL